MEEKVNFAVFPGLQGGPHNHTIGALSVALKQANTPEFVEYQKQVLKNCARLSSELQSMGYDIVSGGTDNHLVLVNVKSSKGIDGARVERVLELACIASNKNTVPGEKRSPFVTSGIRVGTPAMTTRGMGTAESRQVADYIADVLANPGDETMLSRIRGEIHEMCGRYPVYPV